MKTAAISVVSGIFAALVMLLMMPLAFGVTPNDLLSGKLAELKESGGKSADKTVKVVSSGTGGVSVEDIAQKVIPAIVNIDVSSRRNNNSLFDYTEEGTGSGVIYGEEGYVVTNNHVIEKASEITVTLASGEELTGRVVGADAESDIAVLKVDKSGLPAIKRGDSDTLVIGQLAVAVGSPFGFEHSVTTGIVSALHRNVSTSSQVGAQETTVLTDLIQTDAAINPGNSGGALCNDQGELIAINTVIASSSGGSEGVGFAIPINMVSRVADDLIAGKAVSHPFIGVWGQSISKSISQKYGLAVEEGAYVTGVISGGPAEKAGLKQGDIVVKVEGAKVKSMDDLVSEIRKRNAGDKMKVTYVASGGGGTKTVEVTVEEDSGR
ncbi:MAG: trypsin-like peptidase domain-containing protein [Actinobacteria bacterium]|nr:trypsin-like peptidase domain-containing protein [Actinomycetota bacterium]